MTSLLDTFEAGRGRHTMDLLPDDNSSVSYYPSFQETPSPSYNSIGEVSTSTPPSASRVFRAASVRRPSFYAALDDGVLLDLHITINASPLSSSRSASTDPWSTSALVEEDPIMDPSSDEPEDFDPLLEPKLELQEDDDVRMEDLQASESVSAPEDTAPTPRTKRPRGRPRKHPLAPVDSAAKVQKGRSKTGCITCRRRKKKCDETKPVCLNCEKNRVICEGYQPLTIWQPGRGDKSGDEGTNTTSRRQSMHTLVEAAIRPRPLVIQDFPLAPIIHGVETPGDRIFFEHYCFRLSAVLTVEGPRKNAFNDMLLPMAIQHLGLMHSILALSSTNIDYHEPYGKALIAKHNVDEETLKERSEYHREKAWEHLKLSAQREVEGIMEENALAIRYGQMLCFVVESIAEGKATGEHRIHLNAYRNMSQGNQPLEGPFMEFIEEYFQYHIGLDDLISLPPGRNLSLGAIDEDWSLHSVIQSDAVRLLGVQDGLFFYMSKITAIRNTIRQNMKLGINPVVDYTSLCRATEIDAGIRSWRPSWPPGDSRDLAGLLYKQMMWVYLWRTIYPPKTTTWQPEYKITEVVNEGLKLLKLFPPKDPVQTLLLAPTFIIGCAAFDHAQRPQISDSIANIKAYTHLKNTDRALEVLRAVWKYMDEKDEKSWDWQTVAHEMGMDFLAT